MRSAAVLTPEIDLSIVIVNWHSRLYVDACVTTLPAACAGLAYEVIVVDAASFDGCEAMLRERHPWVRFLQTDQNAGFGRASTWGADIARGRTLLFLNPDTEVPAGTISLLHDHLRRLEDAGAVSCRLVNTDGSLQTSCVQALPTLLNQVLDADVIRKRFRMASIFGTAALFSEGPAAVAVEAVSGACLMILRTRFDSVDGYSPEYFMYGEDLDLCFKLRAAGFRNYHIRACTVIHHGGGSSQHAAGRFASVMLMESVNRLIRRSRGTWYARVHRVAMIGIAAARLTALSVLAAYEQMVRVERHRSNAARRWLFVLSWSLGFERRIARDAGATLQVGTAVRCSCAASAEN